MNIRNIIWWILFFILAISLQDALPGLDALVIGLLISMQERKLLQVLWVMPVMVFIQEGCGSLDFGPSALWYTAVICLFIMGRWLFEVENLLFMFLLSACMGLAHMGIIKTFAMLQDININMERLLDESILQALFIPLAWKLAYFTRRLMVLRYENTA